MDNTSIPQDSGSDLLNRMLQDETASPIRPAVWPASSNAPLSNSSKPLHVVLVQPSEPFGAWAGLPISLIDMAAILKASNISVEILDARADNLTVSQTIQRLKGKTISVAGITGLTNAYRFIKDFCFEFKRNFPEVPLVGGGAFIREEYERVLRRTPIDVACTAEGEEIIVELVNRLANGAGLEGIPNLAYLKDGVIVKSEIKWVQDFNRFPFPAYELLDMQRYKQPANPNQPSGSYFPIVTGRGCIHHCYFCGRPGKGVRRPSADRVLQHMDLLYERYGIDSFSFYEDSAFYPRDFLIRFSKLYQEQGKKYKLSIAGCPEQVDDDELLDCVSKMACTELNIAVENWSPLIQKGFYRVTQSKHVFSALEKIRNHRLLSYNFNILWGHPQDTAASFRDSYRRSVEVARKYDITMFSFAALVIYPNSDLQEDALKKGKITDYEDYMYACGGYGPYVNITTEDDDVYRGVIAEMRFVQEIDLLLDKLRFILFGGVSVDIGVFETFRNELQRLTSNLTLLRQILMLPVPQREQYRQALEGLLAANMYQANHNYYHELACYREVLNLPKGSQVMVACRDAFPGDLLAKLFNSFRESGLHMKGFIERQPVETHFEGYPLVNVQGARAMAPEYVLLPETGVEIEFLKTALPVELPGIRLMTISKESLRLKPWLSGGLNGWFNNPDFWSIALEGNQLVPKWHPNKVG